MPLLLSIPRHTKYSAVLLSLSVLLFSGCKSGQEATPTPVVYVQAEHPEQGSISEQIAADAVLAPVAQAAIATKITAPVEKFYVQRGSRVHAGELLATLENSDLAAAVLDNKGAYTAAQANYATDTESTVPEAYASAKLAVTQAKATLDLDQSIVDARTRLFAQGAIPGRDLDTARATLVQSQAAYDIANQHLQALQKVSNKAALEAAQGNLASAKGKYLGAQAQLSYTEIRSPISGVVTDRPLYAGETASAGTPVITVMDTSALIAKLHIAESQAAQLVLGGPAQLTIPGISAPVPAKVSLISPALDPGSTTVEVWLRVENPKGRYIAGTPVHAVITGRTVKDALLVPPDAIQAGPDGTSRFVMVVGPDSLAHKHIITLGIQTADDTQVLTGLQPSDMVITSGGYGLDDGTNVKIGADPSAKPDADSDAPAPGAAKPAAATPAAGKDAAAK